MLKDRSNVRFSISQQLESELGAMHLRAILMGTVNQNPTDLSFHVTLTSILRNKHASIWLAVVSNAGAINVNLREKHNLSAVRDDLSRWDIEELASSFHLTRSDAANVSSKALPKHMQPLRPGSAAKRHGKCTNKLCSLNVKK